MSWNPDPGTVSPDDVGGDGIEALIVPRSRDLGGFAVRRALPSPKRQMVGPFIFFDQMGPSEFLLGEGIDVRPHPHIGLATVTYLFDGIAGVGIPQLRIVIGLPAHRNLPCCVASALHST